MTATQFHFIHPYWLLALLPLWLGAGWLAWRGARIGGWSGVIDPDLLSDLRLGGEGTSRAPWLLLCLIWLVAVLALAGPAWQREESTAYRAPANWIVLLDLSPSMAAADMSPSRVIRAHYGIEDVLNRARDARVSLIAFAGEAHVVAPLTSDVATVRALLGPLTPRIMPESGNQLAPALEEAQRMIQAGNGAPIQLLVFTDGVSDPVQSLQLARDLRVMGAQVNVVGVGTEAGAPAPDATGQFSADAQGRSILSRLPVGQLQSIAAAGGGHYVALDELSGLVALMQAEHSRDLTENQTRTDERVNTWRNGGVWLLPLLLLLAIPMARRGWL